MTRLLNFGFSSSGINQILLATQPAGFLKAVWRGLPALDARLLFKMNPAELLGASAGYYHAVTFKENVLGKNPAITYRMLFDVGRENYAAQIESIDDESFARNVRPYTSDLLARLNDIVLSEEDSKQIVEKAEKHVADMKEMYDPNRNRFQGTAVQRRYASHIHGAFTKKYEKYHDDMAQKTDEAIGKGQVSQPNLF